VREILNEIIIDTLEEVFREWINRLDWTDALQHCRKWKAEGMK
jgi:hypothetical protein